MSEQGDALSFVNRFEAESLNRRYLVAMGWDYGMRGCGNQPYGRECGYADE